MSMPSQWIDEKTRIPDMLRVAPQLRPILDRYGLRGCGGPQGPNESLDFFAQAHDVPLQRLLAELRERLRQSAASTNSADAGPSSHWEDAIYRPFFKAGIAVVLTAGAVWGAYLLVRIAWQGSFAAAGLHEVNAHGHAQIFGWVGLFVMGFAYQAFPRFKHTSLAFPSLAWTSLWLMLAGIVGRSFGEPLASRVPWMGSIAVASAWLEVVAIAAFAGIVLATWRASGKGLAFYDYYIAASLAWFVFQAVFEALYLRATLAATTQADLTALVATWQGALREAQIHGFALLMILGVSQHLLPHFYGFRDPSRRVSVAALVCLNIAVAGELTGLVLMRTGGRAWAALWYASVLVLAGSVGGLLWDWRIFGRAGRSERTRKFIRAAYAWLVISLAMLMLIPVYQFVLLPWLAPTSAAAALGFSHVYYGAIRHAITVGFISLMIVGVAARVVPTLNGVDASRLTPLWGPFLLLNAGCALRVVTQTLTDFTPDAFPVAGISGLLEVTGLALWGAHLWAVMAGCPRLRDAAPEIETTDAYRPGSPIAADHRVGELLDAHPVLLDTFLALGFRPLANPLLRHTIARRVTVGQACGQLGLDTQHVIAALNGAAGHPVEQRFSLPLVVGFTSSSLYGSSENQEHPGK
jgi:hypothetical protein